MFVCFIYPFPEKFKDKCVINRPLDGLGLILRNRLSLDDSILVYNIVFCSCVNTRKHVEWYWRGLCGQFFIPVFTTRKESPLDQRVVQTKTTINTHARALARTHRLGVEWAKRLQNFFYAIRRSVIWWDAQDCCPQNRSRHSNMGEAVIHGQRLSITLRCLAAGNNLEDIKFVWLTLSQLHLLCFWRVYGSPDRRGLNEYWAIMPTDCSVYCATLQYHP
jgi:hypothetical protein